MNETINAREIGRLLGLAAARDQRTVGDADTFAWYADLNTARVTLPEAEAALTHYYAVVWVAQKPEHRFRITAPQIIEIVKKARKERLEEFAYDPPDEDEPGWLYVRRLRQQIAETAQGRPRTTVREQHRVTARPERVALLAAAVADRAQLPPENPAAASVPVVDPRVGDDGDRRGHLGVECPTCGALVGRRCRWPGSRSEVSPHRARVRVAAGGPVADPAEAQAEQQRRAAAAAALARLSPEERSRLEEFQRGIGGAA